MLITVRRPAIAVSVFSVCVSNSDVISTSAVGVIKDCAVGASSEITILINDIRISDHGATGRADQRPGHVRRASNVQGRQFCRAKVV